MFIAHIYAFKSKMWAICYCLYIRVPYLNILVSKEALL